MLYVTIARIGAGQSGRPGSKQTVTNGEEDAVKRFLMTMVAVLAAAAWTSGGSAADQASIRAATSNVDGGRVANADSEPGNWLAHGRTYSEQRFSPLDQITDGNISKLGLAWHRDLDTNRGIEATPIVVDGVMFATGPWSVVWAMDAKTGDVIWEYDPEVPKEWGQNACCDVVNRGVALWQGKVYVGTLDGRLVAVDAATGKKVWEVNTIDRSMPYTITGAPRVVKGKVLIGNGGAELGVRGYVTAYDAETGTQAWRFHTVPGDPAKGFENAAMARAATTWYGQWWKLGGGGTVWDHMAYDPELDLIYVGVGNGSPWSRQARSAGKGDNLYLSSVLAIRPDTGDLVWYYQTTPGDSWDYTATQHMILADLELGGKTRKVLMQAPKNGFFYVLDRATGELISAEKYVNVTWAAGVDLKTGRPIEIPAARYDNGPAVVFPSPFGGHNWHPMSFNPKTGLVYIPAMEIPFVYNLDPRGFKHAPGLGNWNLGLDAPRSLTAFPRSIAKGHLSAWDPVKQKEAWRVQFDSPWNGGTLTTAGNLVFQGNAKGELVAYRADTGEKVWDFFAQTGVIAAPVTYTVDGEQYVSVLAGWGGVFSLIAGDAAKATGQRHVGRMLTFRIGGTAELPKLDPVAALPKPQPVPASATAKVIAEGTELYAANCNHCHGIGAVGGGVLRDIRYSSKEVFDRYEEIVLKGELKALGMPAFGHKLSASDLDAIKAYLLSEANKEHAAMQEKKSE